MRAENELPGPSDASRSASAAIWIERRDRDDWKDSDQAEFDAWLMEAAGNRAAYWRLEAAWKDTDRLAAFRPAQEAVAGRRFSPAIFRFAAAIVLLAVCGSLAAAYLLAPRERVYATAIGGHRVLTLNDGSRIELNTDSVVRVSENRNSRQVSLDKGEAYFEVRHDSVRPFVVTIGNGRITDLGTKFLVRREPDRLRVAVLDGRVRYEENSANNGHAIAVLNAGDLAVAIAGSVAVKKRAPSELASALAWRRGILVFDNATLVEVAAEFNRYNSTKLFVADLASAHMQIAGTFHADNLEAFVQTVQRVLMLHVEKRGESIVISR
jgi:transmembrane sensor